MMPLRVIKLGGSLLESRDWSARFTRWLQSAPEARTLCLVGGGPAVDAIRDMSQLHHYCAEFLHWLCIDAMDISYRLVQQQTNWPGLRTRADLQKWLAEAAPTCAMVHVQAFYRRDNYQQLPVLLPLGWETTSDSLAALLAHVVDADELIVVKSCSVTQSVDWPTLARAGMVDAAFERAVRGLRSVRLIALGDH